MGVLLFEIFSLAPEALQLFSFKNVEDLYESPMLKAHGKAVVGAVDATVHLLDDVSKLIPILKNLGSSTTEKNCWGTLRCRRASCGKCDWVCAEWVVGGANKRMGEGVFDD